MNPIIEYLTGMNVLTDQIIATDLLLAAKNGVRNYALAITDTVTPEIREALIFQLEESIDLYEEIADYMIRNGMYQPWNPDEQLQLDLRNAQTALALPSP